MPEHPQGTSQLEVSVGQGKSERLFAFPLSFSNSWVLDLRTDRQLYEPGETVQVWARLRDHRSHRPRAGVPIQLSVLGTSMENHPVKTGDSGVAATSVTIPKAAAEGQYEVIARIGRTDVRQSFRIGTRSYERLFAEVKVTPETAQPHQPIEIAVKVTTASGALLRNAAVSVEIDKEQASAVTDRQGLARVSMRAPAYMTHATGSVPILARVTHAAQGSASARGTLKVAVPLTLEVEAVPGNAALVPDLDGVLYVRLSEGSGTPPPTGTPVEVSGAAIRNGRQRGQTDAHGIVAIGTRLGRGSATSNDDAAATTIIVHVEGEAPRTAAISVAVARETEVVPTVNKTVVAPGDALVIKLARRPSAVRVPVVVELLSATGLIEARVVDAGVNQIAMKAPTDRVGVIEVRARPLHQGGVVEGTGGVDAFLVRPSTPSFPTLKSDKELYAVKSSARLTLQTDPGAPPSWAAVLVRDLAAHTAETPFQLHFLSGAFDRAILDPKAPAAETLLRTALAAHIYQDPEPTLAPPLVDEFGEPQGNGYGLEASQEREVLRDPFPLADELSRRGAGTIMIALEELLASALDEGRLDEVATRTGRTHQFRPDLLAGFEDRPRTLGEGKLSLAMLHAADPSFTYDNVAKRVARLRLIKLLVALAVYVDPGDAATPQQRAAAREPSDRWLSRMIEEGLITSAALADPWGGSFALRRTARPRLAIAVEAANLELFSPGPDGKAGTRDDIVDPFARALPQGTPYAVASGEDQLMAELARLSPGDDVLRRLLEAYQRVTAEVAEEIIGDAVNASMSEGFGTIGTGAGGGGVGYGSGSGSGSLRGRSATAPSVRVGSANARGGMGGFARVVRERFPPTLFFAPDLAVNPSGQTEIEIALSDAVTTYVVEAVVWSADGFTWSTSTTIRVDKEIVIDAPIPRYATVGDRIRLPVRVGNRTPSDRKVTVQAFAPDAPDEPLFGGKDISVPGSDTTLIPVALRLTHAMEGAVTLGVRSAKGTALDAVRRPISVYAPSRRVRRSVDLLASATAKLSLTVDSRATPRDGAEVILRVGAGIFELPSDAAWAEWALAWAPKHGAAIGADTMQSLAGSDALALSRAIGAGWTADAVPDDALALGLNKLTLALDALARSDSDPKDLLTSRAAILLFLAPATHAMHERPELAADLQSVLRSLRKVSQSSVAAMSDQPHVWALAAAALALTAPPKARLDRVRELVRRVRRYQLQVGEHTWIATKEGGHATSALLALAELQLGERERALALLRSLGRLNIHGKVLDARSQAFARVAAWRASKGRSATSVRLRINDDQRDIALESGMARVPAPLLSRPGHHTIQIDTGDSAPALYYIEAVTEYGLPWDVVPERPGSLLVAIEGKAGARNERATLELVVRNRSPRTIARPILEVSIPAGAELDEEAHQAIRYHSAGTAEATRGTLRLTLAGLPPGGKRRIPLPFRWSVGGSLQGLGISAYPADRPEDLSITLPRALTIADAKVTP